MKSKKNSPAVTRTDTLPPSLLQVVNEPGCLRCALVELVFAFLLKLAIAYQRGLGAFGLSQALVALGQPVVGLGMAGPQFCRRFQRRHSFAPVALVGQQYSKLILKFRRVSLQDDGAAQQRSRLRQFIFVRHALWSLRQCDRVKIVCPWVAGIAFVILP